MRDQSTRTFFLLGRRGRRRCRHCRCCRRRRRRRRCRRRRRWRRLLVTCHGLDRHRAVDYVDLDLLAEDTCPARIPAFRLFDLNWLNSFPRDPLHDLYLRLS